MDTSFYSGIGLYGLMAEFDTPEALIKATRQAHTEGYRVMDAYTPMPVDGLPEALGSERTWVSTLVFLGGLAGCVGGFSLMYWITCIAYPMNVGGRPMYSWPAYIPPTFEMTVLFASLTAVIGMLFLNGLPEPYHPVFNVPRFQLASQDRFFLCIEARDPRFNLDTTKSFLAGTGAVEVSEVAK
jgi:hypothetical protein